MSVYVVVLAGSNAIVFHGPVAEELFWTYNPSALVALFVQLMVIVFLVELTNVRFVGAAGSWLTGVTLLEGLDAGLVPIAFVAVTVKV